MDRRGGMPPPDRRENRDHHRPNPHHQNHHPNHHHQNHQQQHQQQHRHQNPHQNPQQTSGPRRHRSNGRQRPAHSHSQRNPSNRSLSSSTHSSSSHVPSLEMTLRERGCYDDNNEPRRRAALDTLERDILHHWCINLMRDKNNNPWKIPRVALICFGSYRLGVHRPSSDMDVLALSPPHCTRADFFLSLVDRLSRDSRVTDLHPIPSAYTPVIKFVLQGMQIDLLFARLQNATKLFRYQQSQPSLLLTRNDSTDSMNRAPDEPLPKAKHPRVDYVIDDSDLVGLDEAGVRSINGSRVSQFMLSLIPNVETFRLTLRAVKAWAEIHGVQSNVLGFLGGINWAILVARVAIDNPEAGPPQLLLIFFQTYSQWKWPEPVTLGPICTEPPPGVTPMAAWNPKVNPRDGLHLMPIITPVFPSMNSAYNIGIPQLRRIQDEMNRAAYTLEQAHHPGDCSGIFQDGGFFQRHSNYLEINIRARNAEDFLHWFRLCESRMRLLIASLETPEVQAWPFASFFDRRHGPTHESYFFIAIRFAPGVETVDLRYSTSEFLHKINTWEGRREEMDLSIARVSARDLPAFVTGETKANASHQRNRSADVVVCPQMVPEGGMGSPPKRARTVL